MRQIAGWCIGFAAIRVEDHRTSGAALSTGDHEGIGDQIGPQVISGCPADHVAGFDVDDGGQPATDEAPRRVR